MIRILVILSVISLINTQRPSEFTSVESLQNYLSKMLEVTNNATKMINTTKYTPIRNRRDTSTCCIGLLRWGDVELCNGRCCNRYLLYQEIVQGRQFDWCQPPISG